MSIDGCIELYGLDNSQGTEYGRAEFVYCVTCVLNDARHPDTFIARASAANARIHMRALTSIRRLSIVLMAIVLQLFVTRVR